MFPSGMLLIFNYVSRGINQPARRHALITVNGNVFSIRFRPSIDLFCVASYFSHRRVYPVNDSRRSSTAIVLNFLSTCLFPVCPGEGKRDDVVVHAADGRQATARRVQQPAERLSCGRQAAEEHRRGEHVAQKVRGRD